MAADKEILGFAETSPEGWLMSNTSDGRYVIARYDDDPEEIFDCDADARDFVVKKAAEGSPMHLLAISMEGLPYPYPI